ncbi:MAG: hypothetical protein R3F65_06915 [bacterium]
MGGEVLADGFGDRGVDGFGLPVDAVEQLGGQAQGEREAGGGGLAGAEGDVERGGDGGGERGGDGEVAVAVVGAAAEGERFEGDGGAAQGAAGGARSDRGRRRARSGGFGGERVVSPAVRVSAGKIPAAAPPPSWS